MKALTLDNVVRVTNAHQEGKGYMGHCPAHDDQDPSLSISEGKDGKVLYRCFAGCSQDAVTNKLLTLIGSDSSLPPHPKKQTSLSTALVHEVSHTYQTFAGTDALLVKRFRDESTGGKTFRQYRLENGREVPGGYKGDDLAPLGYFDWANDLESIIFLVEGEKCADFLRNLGLKVTTTPGGAQAWKASYAQAFESRRVTILPDNDEPGKGYARKAYSDIKEYAASVKIIKLPVLSDPALAEGFDVVNVFENGLMKSVADLVDYCEGRDDTQQIIGLPTPVEIAPDDNELVEISSEGFTAKLSDAAFHGPVGEYVKYVSTYTESDEVAILVQLLVTIGNMFGRESAFSIEADSHRCNEFVGIVGSSSKARKGTSYGWVQKLLEPIDSEYFSRNLLPGASSGEGIIAAIQDPIESSPSHDQHKHNESVLGVNDKRALIMVSEFGSILKAMERQGNTLSAVLRDAWDSRSLRIVTRNSPAKASNPHISLIGHITNLELKCLLGEVDIHNGLGNRILWFFVRRSKILPFGGCIQDSSLDHYRSEIRTALLIARTSRTVTFSQQARQRWAEFYFANETTELPGILGAITARGAPHVLRLALIYCLLDCRTEIDLPHLEAAIALWNYSMASARHIFGASTGNKTADKILEALESHSEGLSKTTIYKEVFKCNVPSSKINAAIKNLVQLELVHEEKMSTPNGRTEVRVIKGSNVSTYSTYSQQIESHVSETLNERLGPQGYLRVIPNPHGTIVMHPPIEESWMDCEEAPF